VCSFIQPTNVAMPLAAKISTAQKRGRSWGLTLLDLAMAMTLTLDFWPKIQLHLWLWLLADCSCTICRLGVPFLGHPLAAILPLATWFYATNHWHNLRHPLLLPHFLGLLLAGHGAARG